MQSVNVIAVHNTIGDVKPLWVSIDGKKSKIEKINSTYQVGSLTVYHCVVDGCMISLQFDGLHWFID
jgi:hypothetical protein